MSDGVESQAVIHCEACDRKFAWKPALAGRKVKCPCGHVMAVPAEPPAAEDELYDLAPDPAVPKPAAPAAAPARRVAAAPVRSPHAVAPPEVGLPPAAVPAATSDAKAAAARLGLIIPDRKKLADLPPDDDAARIMQRSLVRDTVVPIALIALGVGLCFYETMYAVEAKRQAHSVAAAVSTVGIKLLLAVGLMLGAMAVAPALEVSFPHSFKDSMLRFCAIAVAPCAIYGICAGQLGPLSGGSLGVLFSVVAYTALFKTLLRLDWKDTGICVLVVWILITFANYMAYKAEGLRTEAYF